MHIIAVKIHEDSRDYIPACMKYSKQPASVEEYEEFLEIGEEGKGGLGFHECMNFKVCEDDSVKFYLPPRYTPTPSKTNKSFAIVWVSYSPHKILGVQLNCTIRGDSKNSFLRDDSSFEYKGAPLCYHGFTDSSSSILFNEPLDLIENRHTPKFQRWGSGLRYLKPKHLKNIFEDRVRALSQKRQKNSYENEELSKIRMFVNLPQNDAITTADGQRNHPVPDKVLGDWGENFVYQDQLQRAEKEGLSSKEIIHTSQLDPQSVYDIESIKKTKDGNVPIYIEVKTTQTMENPSILISARQINFARNNSENHLFAFVDASKKTIRYLTLADVEKEYDKIPEKYRLKRK